MIVLEREKGKRHLVFGVSQRRATRSREISVFHGARQSPPECKLSPASQSHLSSSISIVKAIHLSKIKVTGRFDGDLSATHPDPGGSLPAGPSLRRLCVFVSESESVAQVVDQFRFVSTRPVMPLRRAAAAAGLE